ncbi:MAG: GH3 auxin-responsive promoter family protein [Spirochaetes bacterium]|nr:GH3 auxin-responsive promoter family protein [Spirochaetota bacterium]
MNSIINSVIRFRGERLTAEFDAATMDPITVQQQLLSKILHRNAQTEFGRKHHFSSIHDSDGYAKNVPVSTYGDLESNIEKIKNGKKNVLTADMPFMFTLTSGTTDRSKFIPFTAKTKDHLMALTSQWLYRASVDHPKLLTGSGFNIAAGAVEGITEGGVPFGSISGYIREQSSTFLGDLFEVPLTVSGISDYDLRYFLMIRYAMEKDITFITTPNPVTLIKIAEFGIRYQDLIVQSIREGVAVPEHAFENASHEDERIIRVLNRKLRPRPGRADFLSDIIETHGSLLPSWCWPNLAMIGCWLGGSVGYHADRLNELYGAHVPKRDLGFLASEGGFSIPYQDNTPGGILAIQNNYYEFIREDDTVCANPAIYRCHELTRGERYKMIFTGENGLYRYDIDDVVEVIDFYNRTPVIAFVRKGLDMLNITGEKLHVNHFLTSFKKITERSGITIRQFRVVPNFEDLRYEISLSLDNAPAASARNHVLAGIDDCLAQVNVEYRSKRRSRRLNPPRFHIMSPRWEESVRRASIAAGCRDAQFKWKTMSMEPVSMDSRFIMQTI